MRKLNKKLLLILLGSAVLVGILIFVLIRVDYFFPGPTPEGKYYIGNLHTHTKNSDGKMTYEEVITTAEELGFDFIAITDHDTINSTDKSLCLNEKRILCIVGEEVSSNEGHVLAIDIIDTIPPHFSAQETIRMIHEQGGISIIAHPGRYWRITIDKIKEIEGIDAVECNPSTKTEKYNYSCELLPEFPHVYNSDAHRREELSRLANRCRLTVLSINALKEAIKKGDCFEFKFAE